MTPEIVGRYELLRPLGAGGMGEVFLARDRQLGRLVAVKRVLAGNDQAAARRILREARIIATLDHPNIAAVFDVVDHHHVPHVVMEYVEGATLATRVAQGTLPESLVIDYGRQIADALAYAHARNVVHCDIKPSNVVVSTTGVPKVVDFGIARLTAPDHGGARTTTTQAIRGTPAYMAPEVLLGGTPGVQSDIYGLGVLLYELVSGRRPYVGGGSAGVLLAMTAPPPALSSVSGASPALSAVIARAIATDPTKRPASANEFKQALEQVAAGTTRTAPRVRPTTNRAKAAWLGASLVAACVALVLGLPRMDSHNPRTAAPAVVGVMVHNDTGDAENDYLATGLADVLVSQLAGAPGVTVVPRTAVMALVARDATMSGAVKALGLTHVLVGGVQRSGHSLKLTMSLVAGQAVKWSGTFDGVMSDFFHLEQRVAAGALKGLRSEGLLSTETLVQAREKPPTANQDAFDDYAHGRVLLERPDVPGNIDRAMTFFERATARDPGFVRAHAALGEAAWRKYRDTRDTSWIAKARASTLDAIRLDPDDASVVYALAVIDHGTGRIDDAIAALERVIARQPANDDAHRLLGRIYSERGDFDRAIEELREARDIRPEYPATIRELGLAYYDKGLLDEAIASFTKLTTLQPDNAAGFQLLGTAYHAAGNLDRALVGYQRANQLTPRATAYSNIGIIHHTQSRYPEAVNAYRMAIALQPREATTHRNLADSLWMTGDIRSARAEYRTAVDLATQALAVNPAAARLHALVAFCEAKLGRFEVAREALAEALKRAPNDNEVVYKQAVVEALQGNINSALATLGRAIALGYSATRLSADRDLDSLRTAPEFAKLVR